jgi:hypothetical protein
LLLRITISGRISCQWSVLRACGPSIWASCRSISRRRRTACSIFARSCRWATIRARSSTVSIIGRQVARPRAVRRSRAGWRMAQGHLCRGRAPRPRHWPVPARQGPERGSAARHPVRQFAGACAAGAGRHDGRRAVRGDLAALFARLDRSFEAQAHFRAADARHGLCRRGRPLRQGAGFGDDRRHRAGHRPQSGPGREAVTFDEILATEPRAPSRPPTGR